MIRYQIKFDRVARVLDCHGFVERIVVGGDKAELVVYVLKSNKEQFEKLLDATVGVEEYFGQPQNPAVGKVVL